MMMNSIAQYDAEMRALNVQAENLKQKKARYIKRQTAIAELQAAHLDRVVSIGDFLRGAARPSKTELVIHDDFQAAMNTLTDYEAKIRESEYSVLRNHETCLMDKKQRQVAKDKIDEVKSLIRRELQVVSVQKHQAVFSSFA